MRRQQEIEQHVALITAGGHHHSDTTRRRRRRRLQLVGKHIEPTDRLYQYKNFVRETWPPRHSYLILEPHFRTHMT